MREWVEIVECVVEDEKQEDDDEQEDGVGGDWEIGEIVDLRILIFRDFKIQEMGFDGIFDNWSGVKGIQEKDEIEMGKEEMNENGGTGREREVKRV